MRYESMLVRIAILGLALVSSVKGDQAGQKRVIAGLPDPNVADSENKTTPPNIVVFISDDLGRLET